MVDDKYAKDDMPESRFVYPEEPDDDDDYDDFPIEHICPVCGQYDFRDIDTYDACPVCGWQDDSLQETDPDFWGGANELSLNQYKEQWLKKSTK